MSADIIKQALADLARGADVPDIENVFRAILSGEVESAQIASFLTALHIRGESAEHLIAGARIMREKMTRVSLPDEMVIDVCGTGGDMKSTLNISTAVAFVVAAAGVVVAKHGNRAQSSRSGSADLLEQLGIKLDKPEQSIRDIGIGFMFAQSHHPALKPIAPIRAQLGFRTIFNLLGPLCNPALVKRQLLGVFAPEWLEPMALALAQLGTDKAWVVCGDDGMDEITLTTTTSIAELNHGTIKRWTLNPQDYGFALVDDSALTGGSPEDNKEAFIALLNGKAGAYRDIVLLNSAAALVVADKAKDIADGLALAQDSLDNKAQALLQRWIDYA